MRKIYLLLFVISLQGVNAQNLVFTDPAFKTALLTLYNVQGLNSNYLMPDTNGDGEINVTEAAQIGGLYLPSNVQSLADINLLPNLKTISLYGGSFLNPNIVLIHPQLQFVSLQNLNITNADFSGCTNLKYLYLYNNQLQSVNVDGLTYLEDLELGSNPALSTVNIQTNTSLLALTVQNCNFSALDLTECPQLHELNFNNNNLTSVDLSSVPNLVSFYADNNHLATLDLTACTNLYNLSVAGNQLTTLNIAGLSNLDNIDVSGNQLTTLNIDGHPNLKILMCSHNFLTHIDLPQCPILETAYCDNNLFETLDMSLITTDDMGDARTFHHNPNLTSLFIKDGIYNSPYYNNFTGDDALNYICIDESEISETLAALNSLNLNECTVNSYCSFTPGGTFYNISGVAKIDTDNNGCEDTDFTYPFLKLGISDGFTSGTITSDFTGNYHIPLQSGLYTITPVIENPQFFNISPSTFSIELYAQTNPYIQNLCITPNGVHPDVEVMILPLNLPFPGTTLHYKIVYKNKGTQASDGTLQFTFNGTGLNFLDASPVQTTASQNILTWNYTNLQPFEEREIMVSFHLNSPVASPPANSGDLLQFSASLPLTGDEFPADNTFPLTQTVVNSFDPNDKTCLEGSYLTPEMAGNYVHYMIRFENTGTANAKNIVVKDMIDTMKFDLSSLIPLNGSHSFTTRTTGNKVEFIFENIQLPFDDANNDGYVAFKIKTLPTLVTGNSFSNKAEIFFDYNAPIVTNTAVTTFVALGLEENGSDTLKLYPNPANDKLFISTDKEIDNIEVYDISGRIMISSGYSKDGIDVATLPSGSYIVSAKSGNSKTALKFIKK